MRAAPNAESLHVRRKAQVGGPGNDLGGRVTLPRQKRLCRGPSRFFHLSAREGIRSCAVQTRAAKRTARDRGMSTRLILAVGDHHGISLFLSHQKCPGNDPWRKCPRFLEERMTAFEIGLLRIQSAKTGAADQSVSLNAELTA